MSRSSSSAGARGAESPGGERAWSRVAPVYARSFAHFTALAVKALLDGADLGPGARVLDLACGSGVGAAGALARGARAVGLDYSRAMLHEARRSAPDAWFACADAHRLPCRNESFQAVIINFGVHTFADPARALGECRRVLAPGGALALTVWDAAERSVAQGLLERAVHEFGAGGAGAAPQTSAFVDARHTAELLAGAGFEPPRRREVEVRLRATRAEEIFETFRTGTVRLAALIASQSEAALAAIRSAFARSLAPWTGPGGVDVPMQVIVYTARRSGSPGRGQS